MVETELLVETAEVCHNISPNYPIIHGTMKRVADFDAWNIRLKTNERRTLYHQDSGPAGFLYLDSFTVDKFGPHNTLKYEIEIMPLESDNDCGYSMDTDNDHFIVNGILPNLGSISFASHHLGINRNQVNGMNCYTQRNSATDGPLSAIAIDDLHIVGIRYRMKIVPMNHP